MVQEKDIQQRGDLIISQLLEYQEYINQLAERDQNELFYNSSEDHARVVLSKIIEKSKQELYIYCGNMTTYTIFDNKDYLAAFEKFLTGENSKVKILLSDYQESFFNKDICNLLSKYCRKVEIRRTGNKDEIKFDDKPIHFTFADGKMYRLETDIENRMAIGNFNDPDSVKVLYNIFDSYFKISEKFNWSRAV